MTTTTSTPTTTTATTGLKIRIPTSIILDVIRKEKNIIKIPQTVVVKYFVDLFGTYVNEKYPLVESSSDDSSSGSDSESSSDSRSSESSSDSSSESSDSNKRGRENDNVVKLLLKKRKLS